MKLNELKSKKRATEMPMGKNEVIFNKIDYRIDRATEDITGAFVHVNATDPEIGIYKPLYIPVFDDDRNYQLDLLLDQLNCDSYDPDEINKCTGTVIIAHRYIREDKEKGMTYTNVSFNKNYTEEEALA